MKTLTTLLLLILSLNSFSQIQKEQWMIGGNATFSFSQSEELKMSTIQFSPSGGYFFSNKLAGGMRVNFGSETYDWTDHKYRYSNISIAPFLRYYFLPAEQKVNLFADAAYGFAWYKSKEVIYSRSHTYRFNTMSIMAGPAIFINKHTALEVTFGYTHLTRGPVDSTATNKLQVGIGLQIHLGKQKD